MNEKYNANEPIIFTKHADNSLNRIIIPKSFINKYGRDFYLYMYEDKIVVKPVSENKENKEG